ncbi:hypothetical protein MM326_06925 [Alkalihalobacillus sp. LMS6]|nr:DUF6612 family protein [Alkalihalobacillus sp. LMS6]UTR07740.1 hypothetical protein MM326_06925 [Alkalihalobacillus sp. LMS6]
MKKMTWLLVAPASTLMLVACGGDETGGEAGTEDANTNEEVQENESLSIEEVLQRTEDAMNDVNSFRTEMDMTYDVEADGEDGNESMQVGLNTMIDAIADPLAFEMSTTISASELGVDIGMDQYFVDGNFYMQSPLGGEWMSMDISDEMEMEEELQVDEQEQLQMLRDMMDQIEMTEEDNTYVISMEGNNEDVQELIYWYMDMGGQNEMALPQEELEMMMENMEIENMSYSLVIDQETFRQQSVVMNVDMMMEEDGESMSFTMDIDGTYSMYNEIDSIDIPDEVIENSVDLGEEFGDFNIDETDDM